MPKLVTEFPGRCLLAFADFSTVDHHVLLVRAAFDSEGAERRYVEMRTRLPLSLCSGALLRGDSREGGPAPFYVVTTAVRQAVFPQRAQTMYSLPTILGVPGIPVTSTEWLFEEKSRRTEIEGIRQQPGRAGPRFGTPTEPVVSDAVAAIAATLFPSGVV